jgi:hypothetical protein
MWEQVRTLWWLGGSVLIGLALPLAAVMVAVDHRRHRHSASTAFAAVWCALAAGVIGVHQGNLSPPLFGIPLFLLYAVAWTPNRVLVVVGVTASYMSALVVIVAAALEGSEIHWPFGIAWVLSLGALVLWRAGRPSGATRALAA